MIRRGAILLEVLISLALFAGAAAFALRAASQALTRIDRARSQARAMDVARSRLSELEAGLVSLRTITGDDGRVEQIGSRDWRDQPSSWDAWEVSVRVARTEDSGLSLVTITVTNEGSVAASADAVTIVLSEIVRISREDAEEFEENDLLEGVP